MKTILIPFQIDTAGQLTDIGDLITQRIEQAVSNSSEAMEIIFPELALVGADTAEGFFRLTNEQIDQQLKKINKTSKRHPNASIYVGFPYIVNGQRHICHACIKNGRILFVRGKTELANNIGGVIKFNEKNKSTSSARGGVEYETRWFKPAPNGITAITIVGQKNVSFGTYQDNINNNKKFINQESALIVCEEMFVGVEAGGDMEENPIVKLARQNQAKHFIIVNASPNANYKMQNRVNALQKIADYLQAKNINSVTLHYVNNYGTHSAVNFFDGAAHHVYFDTQKNKYIIKSQAHTNKGFSFDTENPTTTANDAEFFLQDNTHEHDNLDVKDASGQPLPYKNELNNVMPLIFADAEYAYTTLRKYAKQYKGYFVSLSGGFDSGFTITTLALALDIKLRKYHKEKGNLQAVIAQMCSDLNITPKRYGQFYHDLMATQDLDTAVALLKKNLIKSAYIKTENNSAETEKAARTLAEEIGAGFEVIEIDDMYIDLLLSYMFKENHEKLLEEQQSSIRTAYKALLNSNNADYVKNYEAFEKCGEAYQLGKPHIIIHWKQKNPVDLENVQARTRAFINWIIADINGLLPTSNPNFNESINGYTTGCGDLHAGKFSLTAHKQKVHIQLQLAYVQKYGIPDNPLMTGSIKPIKNIIHLWKVKPSAELQKLLEGLTIQTDEAAFGLTYHQLFVLAQFMFGPSSNPDENASFINSSELLSELRKTNEFKDYTQLQVLKMLQDVSKRFLFSRFKRRSMPISQVTENSIEPHANLRYPLLGTDEYVYADLNLTYLQLMDPEWALQNQDGIELALLTNTAFQKEVSRCRNASLADKIKPIALADLTTIKNMLNVEAALPSIAATAINPQFIMAANINPIALNYADNVRQIKEHIDEACRKGIKLLVLPEFTLTGHDLDDSVRYIRNRQINLLLNELANYAKARNPELIVALGHPFVPNNTIETDRSQRLVSAVSIFTNGKIEKTILRSEPYHAQNNTPYYFERHMRALNNYHDGIVTTDKNYSVTYNGHSVNIAFCFDAPTANINADIKIQIGGAKATQNTNYIYINQRGAPAASTCQDGQIIYSDLTSRAQQVTSPYSLRDLNFATFNIDKNKQVSLASPETLAQNSHAQLMVAHDAMFAYAYMRSTSLQFTVTLTHDMDSIYNIKIIRSALEQRMHALEPMLLADKVATIIKEMQISLKPDETLPIFDNEGDAITWLLNKKLIVLDVNPQKTPLDPALGVTAKHFPANNKLMQKIIKQIKDKYPNSNAQDFNEEETRKRYIAGVSWMITADHSAIPIGNGTRTSLGLNQMVFGGDLHQAPLSFTLHRSRSEIATILGVTLNNNDDAKYDKWLDRFKKPLCELKAFIKTLEDFNEMKQVYFQWFKGQLERNAMPITPETEDSIDRQTAYREIPCAQPLKHELVELVLAMMNIQVADVQELLSDIQNEAYNIICECLLSEKATTNNDWHNASISISHIIHTRKIATGVQPLFMACNLNQLIHDARYRYKETPLDAYLRLRTLKYANGHRGFATDAGLFEQINMHYKDHPLLNQLDLFYNKQKEIFNEHALQHNNKFDFFGKPLYCIENVNVGEISATHEAKFKFS